MTLPVRPFAELSHALDCAVSREREAFDAFELRFHQLVRSATPEGLASFHRMRADAVERITANIADLQDGRDVLATLAEIEPEIKRLLMRRANLGKRRSA